MNPTVYSVQFDTGTIITVKSFNDAVGVVRRLIPNLKNIRYVPYQRISDKETLVNNNILVKVVDIPLSWVEWCPV